jgi:hypothetical protein
VSPEAHAKVAQLPYAQHTHCTIAAPHLKFIYSAISVICSHYAAVADYVTGLQQHPSKGHTSLLLILHTELRHSLMSATSAALYHPLLLLLLLLLLHPAGTATLARWRLWATALWRTPLLQ